MVEHKTCEECQWNEYPVCNGTIMESGNQMNIENLRSSFRCGQKDYSEVMDFSVKIKSGLEEKYDLLDSRILKLEKKK